MRSYPRGHVTPPRVRQGIGAPITSHPRRWEAYALVALGIGSAAYTVLSYKGHQDIAVAGSLFGGIAAAMLGAVRILSQPAHRAEIPRG